MTNSGYLLGDINLLTKCAENQYTNTYWTIVYIKKGIGMYILDSDLRCLNEGDIIILPPKTSYSFCSVDLGDEYNINVSAITLRFDASWLKTLLSVFKSLNTLALKIQEIEDPYAVEGPKWMKLSTLLDELSNCDAAKEPTILLNILDLISSKKDLIQILKVSPTETLSLPEKIEKINRYITCNIYRKVSLEEVSEYLGMNRTYFCMFFKRHFNKGFADYLNDLRIEQAVSMLTQPDKQIADIARECGFKTAPYFTRAFKKAKGITPFEYRKRIHME